MPTPPTDKPITKVTLNLYTDSIEILKARSPKGMGWTAYLRELVDSVCKRIEENRYG